jgi:hypothetical protein
LRGCAQSRARIRAGRAPPRPAQTRLDQRWCPRPPAARRLRAAAAAGSRRPRATRACTASTRCPASAARLRLPSSGTRAGCSQRSTLRRGPTCPSPGTRACTQRTRSPRYPPFFRITHACVFVCVRGGGASQTVKRRSLTKTPTARPHASRSMQQVLGKQANTHTHTHTHTQWREVPFQSKGAGLYKPFTQI